MEGTSHPAPPTGGFRKTGNGEHMHLNKTNIEEYVKVKSSQVELYCHSLHCGHIVGRDVVPHRTTVLHKYRYTTRSKTV